jgi:archaeal cell division control protein 6
MSMFSDMLRSGESLFLDTVALDYDYQPKIVKFRENEQQRFAVAIRPLLNNSNGRNLFVHGVPGVGKTTACKNVLRELEEETDEIVPLYVNCWKESSTYKIYYRICLDLGFRFIQNKKTNELFEMIKLKLNKKSAVFIFDEIDKLEDTDFLYTILEEIYRKSIFMLTNYRDSYTEMDERIRSRLNPEFVFFRTYKEQEIAGILEERKKYAFVPNVWEDEAFKEIVEKCAETKDVRVGLYLMKEAGNIAEERSSKKITINDVAKAIQKVEDFHIKPKESLDNEQKNILELIRDNDGQKIGDIFSIYSENGGEMSYKSFQRRINKLKDDKFIRTEKSKSGKGNTTLLHYSGNKKLTEF